MVQNVKIISVSKVMKVMKPLFYNIYVQKNYIYDKIILEGIHSLILLTLSLVLIDNN